MTGRQIRATLALMGGLAVPSWTQSINWNQIRNPHLLSGTTGARPACTTGLNGFLYVATDGTPGSNIFACLGITWTLQAGGGGGAGNVIGPGANTSGFLPQWTGTLNTIGTGLPVSQTAAGSTVVQSGAGGTISLGWIPRLGTGVQVPTIGSAYTPGKCITTMADGTLDPTGTGTTCVEYNSGSVTPVNGRLTAWSGISGLLDNGPLFGTSPAANTLVQAGGAGTILAGWLPATINANTTGTAAGLTGYTILGTATQLAVVQGSLINGDCLTSNASHNIVGSGAPCGGGGGGGGTVTSIDISTLTGFLTFAGGPITTSGSFTPAFVAQSGNKILASPSGGGSGAPSMRASVIADLPITTLGSVIYGGASGVPTELVGNITTTQKFLCQTGTGSVSAAPAWCTTTSGIIPPSQGGTGANNTATSGNYLKGNGTNFLTSSGPASGIGACTGQVVTGLNSDAAPTCGAVTSGVVNSSIATTGGDLDTTLPTKVTGVNGSAVPLSALFLGSNGSRQLIGLSATTATAGLNLFTSTLQGLTPLSGGGSTNFLRADGVWAAPPGGGGGGSGGGAAGWSGIPLDFASNTTQYVSPFGGGLASNSETLVAAGFPASATISNLRVQFSAALGGAATLSVTLRSSVGTSSILTCTTAPAGTSCSDTTHSVNVTGGDRLSFLMVPTGTVTAGLPTMTISYAVGTSGIGVTSVSFTGGIISVGSPTSSPALGVTGTSGGIVFFNGPSSWASSGALTSGQFVFGGGPGSAPTSAALTGDLGCIGASCSIVSGAVTGPKLAVVQTRRTCDIVVGDASGSAITNAQLGPQSRMCFIPAAGTIQELVVAADAGTPSVLVARNNGGIGSAITSSALSTAASGGIACATVSGGTGISGVTCSATLQNTSMSAGTYLELSSGTAGGTAKLMTVHVVWTAN